MVSKLYYGNLLIGKITNTKRDFPNLSGNFYSLLKPTDLISLQIIDYMKFSSELSEFYLNATGFDKNTENILLEKEKKFNNLINSSNWRLINSNGEETKILIPTFDKDGIISYRFDI